MSRSFLTVLADFHFAPVTLLIKSLEKGEQVERGEIPAPQVTMANTLTTAAVSAVCVATAFAVSVAVPAGISAAVKALTE